MTKRIFPIVMVAVLAACGGDAGEDASVAVDSTAGATIQGVDSAAAATQAAPLPMDSVTGATTPAPMDSTAHADSGHTAGTDSAAAH